MDDFERQIHAMFDHIWDCEIDHPVFQDTVGELMSAVIQCHKNTPSAQPERKTGKWIDKSGGIEGAWNYCSVCGEPAIDPFDFCPNCGADMREETDDGNN